MKKYIAETCEIVCEDNSKKMQADILSYKENQYLTVSLEKQLKLELRWNGKIYEGKMGKLSFVSHGPKVTTVSQGR